MTAEAVVLNTCGTAMAADSAVTIGDGKNARIYYSDEKIFHLSSKHYVGIMTHGCSCFMSIDWELILALFSKFLGDRVLDTLEDYVHELFRFLESSEYIEVGQDYNFERIAVRFLDRIEERFKSYSSKNHKKEYLSEAEKSDAIEKFLRKIGKKIENEKSTSIYDGDILVKKYQKGIIENFPEIFNDFFINDTLKEETMKLLISFFSKMESPWWSNISSGIVFAGYGSRELFPSVIHFSITGKFNDKLYHTKPDKKDLLQESKSWIGTYAQTDVMQPFISGMDPYFEKTIFRQMEKLSRGIIKLAGKQYKEEIDELKDNFLDKIRNHGDDNYVFPLKKILASLPVNKLAEIAEALVTLTSLRRHMSTEEETVGGPTDVAIITKAEGFVWVKRKILNKKLAGQK